MDKKRMKVIASILVLMLTMTHFNILGTVIAASLESQTQQTNNANVEFDAYFMEESKKVHATQNTIGEENYIYTYFNVKEAGYLKNIIVQAVEPNFTIGETENSQIAKIEENKLYFNQIKNGEPLEVAIPIQNRQAEQVTLEEFNKESIVKLTATYVDGKGKEKQIEKEVKVQLAWTSEKQAELNMQIAKFIPYNINGNKGLVLQTLVQSYLKDNTLPVQENKIEISVPSINNSKPQSVKVMANTTKATNGDEIGQTFTEENYTYNEETNKLTITVKNEKNEQGQIAWSKSAQDEFVVTYVYPEEALNAITENGVKIAISANNELTVYEASQTKAQKEFSGEVTLKEQVNNLVDFSVETNVAELSKGQIYANYNTSKKVETEYQETLVANIGLAELTDKIILEQKVDQFVDQNNKKAEAKETYNKTITISQAQINKILGEEAEVYFYIGNTQIAKIDKETKADEQGNFVISLAEYNTNTLRIETSKPQAEGKLTFVITKAIKGEIGYNKTQVTGFTKLEQNVIGTAVNGQTNFVEKTATKEVALTETTSQAELILENNNLSTIVTNKDVKITAILKTDSFNCSLYHNPTLQIILPSYIEEINIKNIEVFFDTEGSKLALKSYCVVPNTDGTKTISILLEGTQTEYTLAAVSKGVNVVITADITLNKLTANKQDQIKMLYTNNNEKAKATQTNEVFANINIVAPVGLVTTTTVSNYKQGADDLTAINGEEKIAIIPTLTQAKNTTFTMNVINNYNNAIDHVCILGRIPTKGNKDIVSGQDLGSTINMPLTEVLTVNGVDPSKVKIYYSENENASKDLSVASNGWTLTPTNLANVKSYLITLEDSMNTADIISFNYTAQIPENLQHNESAFETYVVYFDNLLDQETIQDKQVATKVGLSTGTGPVLQANLSTTVKHDQEVLAGNYIPFSLSVKNTGTEIAQNVQASIELPSELSYVERQENGDNILAIAGQTATIELGNIAPNQTITKEILLKAELLLSSKEDTTKTQVKANIQATNLEGQLETETITNTIARIYYSVGSSVVSSQSILQEGDNYYYYMEVSSISAYETQEETQLKITLPEELQYQNVEIKDKIQGKETDSSSTYQYDETTRTLVLNLGELQGLNSKIIRLHVKVGTLPEKIYDKTVSVQATISGKQARTQNVEIKPVQISKVGLKVTQTSNIPENAHIAANEDFKYIFTIQNLSSLSLQNVKLTDILPEELILGRIVVTREEGNQTNFYNKEITLSLKGNETVTVEVFVSANILEKTTQISNYAILEYKGNKIAETNKITHTIDKFDDSIFPTEGGGDATSDTKRIMGTVWLDENTNGIRDEQEEKVPNVEVLLFNNQTGTLVTDSQGNIARTTTDENGTYTFAGISQGKYTVIFLYDSINYSATVYQMENVDVSMNSDAIDSQIILNGETKTAAITEEINVTDSNIYSIDLGLISNPKFDLKLEKMVSKITVQNSAGTKTYDFQNEKLARVEIVGNQVPSSTIVVEYKIKVTNEGAISGFVKKIADYMPKEMKFSSELNKDWYTSENGVLYNASLANTMINPGESKEVTLILTKKMTENNLGIYHNEAEIYEAYNDLGIADVDSVPANKASTEDDFSSADVLISIKTGEVVLFVGLSLSIIVSITIGAYFVKRKILR